MLDAIWMGLYLRRLRLLLALLKRIRGPIDLASCRATRDASVCIGAIAWPRFAATIQTWRWSSLIVRWNLDRLVAAITLICENSQAQRFKFRPNVSDYGVS
jgi:hypothetical protein